MQPAQQQTNIPLMLFRIAQNRISSLELGGIYINDYKATPKITKLGWVVTQPMIMLSPDLIAHAYKLNNVVYILNIETKKRVAQLESNNPPQDVPPGIDAIAYTPNGNIIAGQGRGNDNCKIWVWDKNYKEIKSFTLSRQQVQGIKTIDEDRFLCLLNDPDNKRRKVTMFDIRDGSVRDIHIFTSFSSPHIFDVANGKYAICYCN